MDKKLLNSLAAINAAAVSFEQTVGELAGLFPQIPNRFLWKEAISEARPRYAQNGLAEDAVQLAIARRWVQLAQAGRLEAVMDPTTGLIVSEQN